jgi:hypothetical protein
MTLKAIETHYNGYHFRSRLEARWAVFFDTLGIRYQYEPEAFDLGEGICYLPDFWLPEQKWYVEIKPVAPDSEDERKIIALAHYSKVAVFIGGIPAPKRGCWEGVGTWYEDGWITVYGGCGGDSGHLWCACRTGRHFDIHYNGAGDRIDCNCPGYEFNGRGYSHDHPAILKAYTAARSARFDPKGKTA